MKVYMNSHKDVYEHIIRFIHEHDAMYFNNKSVTHNDTQMHYELRMLRDLIIQFLDASPPTGHACEHIR